MTATQLHRARDIAPIDAPPMADGIGMFGWLSLLVIALVAALLVVTF